MLWFTQYGSVAVSELISVCVSGHLGTFASSQFLRITRESLDSPESVSTICRLLEDNCKCPILLHSVAEVSVVVQSVAPMSRLYMIVSVILGPWEFFHGTSNSSCLFLQGFLVNFFIYISYPVSG